MVFIVAHFTATSIELMSGAKSRKWVHHIPTNQPTNWTGVLLISIMGKCKFNVEWTEKTKFKDWLMPEDRNKQQSFFNHQPPKAVADARTTTTSTTIVVFIPHQSLSFWPSG